jgi:hypothetical protein
VPVMPVIWQLFGLGVQLIALTFLITRRKEIF